MSNHIPCTPNIIQLAWGEFISSLVVQGDTESCEVPKNDLEISDNDSTESGKSQTLRYEGKVRFNKVSAMRPGYANIIVKLWHSRHFEWPETDLYIAENARCIEFTDTWSSKEVHWLSENRSKNFRRSNYCRQVMAEFDTGVVWTRVRFPRKHPRVAQESKIQRLLAIIHNAG
jgi:hypothetical protein